MARATWNGAVIADSDNTVVVEGHHYFPAASVKEGHLANSRLRTRCPWKGSADYFDVVVKGETNPNAAWCYPEPSAAAAQIAGHVAFWRGVAVEA